MTEEEQVSRVLEQDQTVTLPSPPPPHSPTRTVAIIKNHALQHRFDIEGRISEAGFEVNPSFRPIWASTPHVLFGGGGSACEAPADMPVIIDRQRKAHGIRR
jgi:hypothetical protein